MDVDPEALPVPPVAQHLFQVQVGIFIGLDEDVVHLESNLTVPLAVDEELGLSRRLQEDER